MAPKHQLRLDLAAALMPHPNKVHRGGEDAVFLSEDGLTFGELMQCTAGSFVSTCSLVGLSNDFTLAYSLLTKEYIQT